MKLRATHMGNAIRKFAVVIACAICISMMVPAVALADYKGVGTGASGVTDFAAFDSDVATVQSQVGAPIYGADIPDGDYMIPTVSQRNRWGYNSYIVTSSSMCYVPSGQGFIRVSGGSITLYFSLTPSYSYVYPGSADAAAADCPDSENPGPNCLPVGSFRVSVPALNAPFTIAAYDGNGANPTRAKWYERRFMVVATPEILQAIEDAKPDPVDPGDDDNGGGTGTGTGTGNGSGGGSAQPNHAANPTPNPTARPTGMTGTPVMVSGMDEEGGSGPAIEVEVVKTFPWMRFAAAGLLILLIVLGMAYRTLLYKRQLKA